MKIEDLKSPYGGKIQNVSIIPEEYSTPIIRGVGLCMFFPRVINIEFSYSCGYVEKYVGYNGEIPKSILLDYKKWNTMWEAAISSIKEVSEPTDKIMTVNGTEYKIQEIRYDLSFVDVAQLDLEKAQNSPLWDEIVKISKGD